MFKKCVLVGVPLLIIGLIIGLCAYGPSQDTGAKTFGECSLSVGAQDLVEVSEHYMLGAKREPRLCIEYRNISSESVNVRIQIFWFWITEGLVKQSGQEDIRGPIQPNQGERLTYKSRADIPQDLIENYLVQVHAKEVGRYELPHVPPGPEIEPEEVIRIS